MNAYEMRQEQRRERFEELAAKAKRESDAVAAESYRMSQAIPMGQPILIGHHSERRDRNYRERMWNKMGKSVELAKKAEYYERRAAAVDNGAISSDDPDAVRKLKEKLAGLEAYQERMKAVNAVVRKKKLTYAEKILEIARVGSISESEAAKLLAGDFAGRLGYPGYALQNNNANIQRVKERIAQLERQHAQAEKQAEAGGPEAIEGNGYTLRFDVAENRIMFEFPGKPAEDVRTVLKRNGFKWSPTRGAWVRFLANGRWAADCVRAALDAKAGAA